MENNLIGWRTITSGYVMKINVVGFEKGKIHYQTEKDGKVYKRKIYENDRGRYFTADGKRFYLLN